MPIPQNPKICPICGNRLIFQCGINAERLEAYLKKKVALVKEEYGKTGNIKACPVCGRLLIDKRLNGGFTCPVCGFAPDTPHPTLRPEFLASLLAGCGLGFAPDTPPLPPLTINGRTFALKREDGTLWLIVGGALPPFVGPGPHKIPVPMHAGLDIKNPRVVAQAWQQVLLRAKAGRDIFAREIQRKHSGLTLGAALSLQTSGLLSPKFHDQMQLASPTADAGYAASLFQIGLLNRVATELEAVKPFIVATPTDGPDEDEIPAADGEKRYFPISVPEDLPPAGQVALSFDGGMSTWVYAASHQKTGGGA